MGRAGFRALERVQAATLGAPTRRARLIARSGSAAIIAGPVAVRRHEASSPKVTSRTQCSSYSIAQWRRSVERSSVPWIRSAVNEATA